MRIEHLRALLTAAQLGSISKAGRKLHINQQQLSKIIQSLEAEFGCPIFERSSKGIQPTPAGQDILATVQTMLSELDSLQERLLKKSARSAAELKGTLTLHTMVNVWPHSKMFDAIDQFTSAHPATNVLFDELAPPQIIETILSQPDHIGLLAKEQTHFGTPLLLPKDLLFLPLYTSKMAALAGQDSDFARRHKTTSLKALQKEPMIVYRPDVNAPPAVAFILAPYGGIQIKYSVSSLTAFYDLLSKGKAISIGLLKDPQDLEQHHIVTIPIRDPVLVETGLLIHQEHRQDPLISAFCDFYLDYFQKN